MFVFPRDFFPALSLGLFLGPFVGFCRAGTAAAVIALALAVTAAAAADAIAPGLWRIISRTETGGVIGPPHESSRCLSATEVGDLATTFSPASGSDHSSCTPVEKSLDGRKLTWRLTCKGQLDMEESGEFQFDGPHHYTATTRKHAAVSGTPMIDSQEVIEAQWVSECP
jgi:hypothetical protein